MRHHERIKSLIRLRVGGSLIGLDNSGAADISVRWRRVCVYVKHLMKLKKNMWRCWNNPCKISYRSGKGSYMHIYEGQYLNIKWSSLKESFFLYIPLTHLKILGLLYAQTFVPRYRYSFITDGAIWLQSECSPHGWGQLSLTTLWQRIKKHDERSSSRAGRQSCDAF